MKIFLRIFLLLSFSAQGWAQIDSAYIRPYDNKFMFLGYMTKDLLMLVTETPGQEFAYMPNNPVELGLGFYRHFPADLLQTYCRYPFFI